VKFCLLEDGLLTVAVHETVWITQTSLMNYPLITLADVFSS